MVAGQYAPFGMGSPFALSIPAIKIVMDLYEITEQKECLSKVMQIGNYFIALKFTE